MYSCKDMMLRFLHCPSREAFDTYANMATEGIKPKWTKGFCPVKDKISILQME